MPSSVSDIGKSFATKLPDLLGKMVSDAVQNRAIGEDVLDFISRGMHWNFQATKPDSLEDRDPVYAVAFKLFAQHVAGSGQLVDYIERASEGMIRPPQTMQRLGQTIQAAVAVPAA